MAKICTKCGAGQPDGAAFCTECGASMAPAGTSVGMPEPTLTGTPVSIDASAPAGGMYDGAPEYIDPPAYAAGPQREARQEGDGYGAPAAARPAARHEARPGARSAYAASPPPYNPQQEYQPPPQGSPYALVGIGKFLGMMVLAFIPLVNIIMMIIWAAGGSKNRNVRNFGRAGLILYGIVVVLWVVLFAAMAAFFAQYADEFQNIFDSLYYM